MRRDIRFTTSLEKISLTRKFAILFFLMTILPFSFVAYLLYHYWNNLEPDENLLLIISCVAALSALAGFYGMRKSILKIQKLTTQATEALSKNIPGLNKIKSEESEVIQLARTFNEVTRNLENNIKL